MLVGVCLACLGTSPRLGVEARRQKAGQDLGLLETQDQVSLLRKARQHLVRGVRAHLSAAADVCGCASPSIPTGPCPASCLCGVHPRRKSPSTPRRRLAPRLLTSAPCTTLRKISHSHPPPPHHPPPGHPPLLPSTNPPPPPPTAPPTYNAHGIGLLFSAPLRLSAVLSAAFTMTLAIFAVVYALRRL
jgi:hypothetical protein